jgi:hypothetical protein
MTCAPVNRPAPACCWLQNGVCAKQTKTAAKGPYGGVGVARQTTVRAAGH